MVEKQEIIKDVYYNLLVVLLIVVSLYEFNVLTDYIFNYYALVLIVGILGIFVKARDNEYVLPSFILILSIALVVVVRVIPYIGNSVPLGYDPGIYKEIFERPFQGGWVLSHSPLFFSLVMHFFTILFGSDFVLGPLLIVFSSLTIITLYFVVKKFFGRNTGIIAAALFAVSIAQFQTFWYCYYKNIIGINMLLISLLFFKKGAKFNWPLVISGGLLFGIHRPAAFLFGIGYFIFSLMDYRNIKFRVSEILVILLFGMLLNIDRIYPFIISQFISTASNFVGGGGGTFFNLRSYFFYSIPLLAFAITGFFKAKNALALKIVGVLSAMIVFFNLFFHNRFIIYFDIFVIIFAAVGFDFLIRRSKVFGQVLLYSFLAVFSVLIVMHSMQAQPLLTDEELNAIINLNNVLPSNASLLVTDSFYSPWIEGYVDRHVIAPGLFDNNKMSYDEWIDFWEGNNRPEYLSRYPSPLYVHVGTKQPQYYFDNECFTPVFNNSNPYMSLYLFECD